MSVRGVNISVTPDIDELVEVAKRLKDRERGARAEFIDELASIIVQESTIVTTPAWVTYCWNGSIYVECENDLKQAIEEYGSVYGVSEHISINLVKEVLEKIKRITYVSPTQLENTRWYIAVRNGLINVRKWVREGVLELEEFRRDVFKTAVINAEFIPPPEDMTTENWFEYGPKLCPKIHKAFIDWVGEENAKVLYEVVGYCLFPDYPLHIAVMLVGEGSNGKSTFINLLRRFLGRGNYASIPLQMLTTNRFVLGELYGKLANIFPDLPKTPLMNTGIFKALTGQDEVYADVKHKRGFSFVNHAKMIFSANELPAVNDNTYAFWRRWIVIEFPNKFPPNEDFIETLTTPEELSGLLIMVLHALKALLDRKSFSIAGDFKEMWMRRANTVYGFIKDALEACSDPRECFTQKEELYNAYVDWCADQGLTALTHAKFTQEFRRLMGSKVRLGKMRVNGKLTRVWYGVRLREPLNEEEGAGETLAEYLKIREELTTQTRPTLTMTDGGERESSESKVGNEVREVKVTRDAVSAVGKIILEGCVEEGTLKRRAEKEYGLKEPEVEEALAKLIALGLIDEVEGDGGVRYCPA